MDDRQRLEDIISVVCKYLPPDGIHANVAMSEIISSLVDPLPPPQPVQRQRPWVGLTAEDFSSIKFPTEMRFPAEFRAGARWAEVKLKEKNT